jgi:hypothetical protein
MIISIPSNNPLLSLGIRSVSEEHQLQVVRYMGVASCAVCTTFLSVIIDNTDNCQQIYGWDWIVSIATEYKIVSKHGLSKPLAVYFFSR